MVVIIEKLNNEKMSNKIFDQVLLPLKLLSNDSSTAEQTNIEHQNNDNFADLETEGGEDERENWGSKWEFIFSCVGLSVGIGINFLLCITGISPLYN